MTTILTRQFQHKTILINMTTKAMNTDSTNVEQFKKTGWFTFFIALTAILPLISQAFNALGNLFTIFIGASFSSFKNTYGNDGAAAFGAVNAFSGLGGLVVDAALITLFVFYVRWLWRARTALQAINEDNVTEKLTESQAYLLRYSKLSSILSIIGLVLAGIVLVAVIGLFFIGLANIPK
jgi:hypothetical protein